MWDLLCSICVLAGILHDHVQRGKQDGAGRSTCFGFILFIVGKIRQGERQKTPIIVSALKFQMQGDETGMEIDSEDPGERLFPSLATNLLPSENKQLCSLLVRIEADLSQIIEKPHKQEDRDIDSSLLKVKT